jgi:hypothetical protein
VREAAVAAALDLAQVLLQRLLGLALQRRVERGLDAQPAGVEQLAEDRSSSSRRMCSTK